MSFSEDKFSEDSRLHLAQIIDNINAGIWEYNINTRAIKWSTGFYTILGYEPDEIECSNHLFFEHLLYHEDKSVFLNALNNPNTAKPVQIRLLTKATGYHWFESTIKKHGDEMGHAIYGSIININQYKQAELLSARHDQLYSDTIKIAKLGSWEIEAGTQSLTLSKQIYDIYELQSQVKLTLEEAISFFEPPYRPVIQTAIKNALEFCQPYDP